MITAQEQTVGKEEERYEESENFESEKEVLVWERESHACWVGREKGTGELVFWEELIRARGEGQESVRTVCG